MKPPAVLAPLLLTACVSQWPARSYVEMHADADATVLAPAMTECINQLVPAKSVVALPPSDSPFSTVLSDDLTRSGLLVQAGGAPLSYTVAPLDAGAFVRVAASQGTCAQYFLRVSNGLHPDGPLMVMTQ